MDAFHPSQFDVEALEEHRVLNTVSYTHSDHEIKNFHHLGQLIDIIGLSKITQQIRKNGSQFMHWNSQGSSYCVNNLLRLKPILFRVPRHLAKGAHILLFILMSFGLTCLSSRFSFMPRVALVTLVTSKCNR